MSYRIRTIFILGAAAIMAGCGGGGGGGDDPPPPCSSATSLVLTLTWVSNGVPSGTWVEGKVGQPLVADPVIAGLPASCTGKLSFALGTNTLPSGPSALPPGLSLDAATGRISGTATQSLGISGPSFTVQAQGYAPAKFIFNISIVP